MLAQTLHEANRELSSRGAVVGPAKPAKPTPGTPRRKVLLICEGGRFLGVYAAENDTDFQLVNLPQVAPKNEAALLELAEEILPKCYADLLCQGWKRASLEVENVSLPELQWRIDQMRMMDELSASRREANQRTSEQAIFRRRALVAMGGPAR